MMRILHTLKEIVANRKDKDGKLKEFPDVRSSQILWYSELVEREGVHTIVLQIFSKDGTWVGEITYPDSHPTP